MTFIAYTILVLLLLLLLMLERFARAAERETHAGGENFLPRVQVIIRASTKSRAHV